MRRLCTRFWLLLLAGCLLTGAAAGSDGETSDRELVATIQLYRSEGAQSALPELVRLLQQFELAGDRLDSATTLRYIGESHWRMGEFEPSREFLVRALALSRELGDRFGEGKALNVIGLLEWDLGNFEAALEALEEANAIAVAIGNDRLTASTLNNMGLVHDELGDYRASFDEYGRAYTLFNELGDLRGQGDALGNTGGVHLLLGHFAKALDHYQRALAISEELASKPAMTIDHGNIALCFLGLGQFEQAVAHFDRALELATETGMRQEEAYWQRGKANALIRQGRFDLGLENHRRALATYEETGARGLLLDALHDMGRLHLSLGDPVSADGYFQRALSLAREIGHEQVVTANLVALGELRFRMEQLEEAQALYAQALQRAEAAEETGYQIEAHLRLAGVEQAASRFDDATVHARTALGLARETGAGASTAEAWFALAEAARGSADTATAFAAYDTAEEAVGGSADPGLAWQIRYGRGLTHVLANDKERAVAELLAAAGIIEGVRDRLREDRFRAGYLQDKYQVYIDLVRLQLELGRTRDAFSAAERLRARSFIAQLDQGGPVARTEAERRSEMALRERIRQLQVLLTEEQARQAPERRQLAIDAFSSELMLAEREYQAFLDDLDSTPITLGVMALPGLEEIQGRMGPAEALVEYVVTNNSVLLFIVNRESIAAASSDLDGRSLQAKIKLVRAMIQQPGSERWRKPAASLAQHLLKPALDSGLLDQATHLHLVPHGMLNYLPFAVLPVPSGEAELLVERFTLSYLPAAAALAQPAPGHPGTLSLLAVAPQKTRLKYAPEEARSISDLFRPDTRLLAGPDATESAFKHSAPKYRVLHLATHGYFNRRNPLLSGLELEADRTNDGLLEVHEILELDLTAQLVTLSACQTGLGSGWFDEIPAGDDFVGLTRAFLYAGSQAVLATLWEVDDRSTVDLMEGFYRRLAHPAAAVDHATALARAQRLLRSSRDYSHPFYWAPFVLVGQHGHARAQS